MGGFHVLATTIRAGGVPAACESEDGERRVFSKEAYRISRDAEEESDATTLAPVLETYFSVFFYLSKVIYISCWSCSKSLFVILVIVWRYNQWN